MRFEVSGFIVREADSAVDEVRTIIQLRRLPERGSPSFAQPLLKRSRGSTHGSARGGNAYQPASASSGGTGARHGLDAAHIAVASEHPHEMLLLDLYEALRGLDALTGATTTDDVLHLIFSRFCIGK